MPTLMRSTLAVLAAAVLWVFLRVLLPGDAFVPLTYMIPMMVCVWTRRYWQVWAMAGWFIGASTVEFQWAEQPARVSALWPHAVTSFNIVVGSLIIGAIIRLRLGLEAKSRNLQQSGEEASAQAEALKRQKEAIESQSGELARQNALLQGANADLKRRETLLQVFLEHARTPNSGERSLEAMCRRMVAVIGRPAMSLGLLQREGDALTLVATTDRCGGVASGDWPYEGSIAELVISSKCTLSIQDVNERPEVSLPCCAGKGRSALATPLYIRGLASGALVVCGEEPWQWTQEQQQILEWLAVQCSLILESIAWREELKDAAMIPQQNPDAILRVRIDGIVTYANPAGEALLAERSCSVNRHVPQELWSYALTAMECGLRDDRMITLGKSAYSVRYVPMPGSGHVAIYARDMTAFYRIQEQLLSVLESSEDLVYRRNLTREEYDYVSPSCQEIFGMHPDQLAHMTMHEVLQLLHPDDVAAVQRGMELASRTGAAHLEYRWRMPDGQWRWMSDRVRVTRDASGRTVSRGGTVRDITEQKMAEEALRASEERFRATFEQAPIGIAHVGLDGRWMRVNSRYCQILGYTRDELLDLTFQQVTHRDDLEQDFLHAQRMLSGEVAVYANEQRCIRKDGSLVWVNLTGTLVRNGNGEPWYFIAAAEDISARRQAEETMRRRAEEVERLLEVVPAAVWVATDPECRTIVGNRRANEFYEADHGQNVSATTNPAARSFYDVSGRKLSAGELPMQLAAATNRDVHDMELHVRTASGRHRAMLGSAVPLRDENGDVRGCIGAFMDISDRSRAEAEMRSAKEAAEAANRAKDHFIAALSHELRTPLTPALTIATLLEGDPRLSQEHRNDAAMIRRNIMLETRLIDDLLDLTRISRGKMELRMGHVDLPELLSHTVQICSVEADAKGLAVTVDLSAISGCAVRGDRERLQQVFWNLLKNATKFTPTGGVITITANVVKGRGDGYDAVIDTCDTGRGIDPAVLPRLFKPFEQGDPAITREYGGLGLGLSICHELVHLHGGDIEACSDGAGRGSRFRVRLPLAGSAPISSSPHHPHRPAALSGMPASLRILLIEDHHDTARIMTRVLKMAGHTVHRASCVSAALEIADKARFDLVLSDLGLPDGSGLDLMRKLRATTNHFRAIALSGYGTDMDIKRSTEAGFDAHLTKPINLELLAETIRGMTFDLSGTVAAR